MAADDARADTTEPESNVIETIQSLIVAFVVAMTFRAFVTEGFVIPTGSMAPTLLGQHLALRGPETGFSYTVGIDARMNLDGGRALERLADPLLGSAAKGTGRNAARGGERGRAGDRILIHKSLYAFRDPERFDVVVFKNPTNPNGADGNFIKRLVGLPGESVWLVDGDVFVTDAASAADFGSYSIRRKPDHVQRAVWQPIYRSVNQPRNETTVRSPFFSDGFRWNEADGTYVNEQPAGFLEWDKVRPIDDWASYNQLMSQALPDGAAVGDVRVAATATPAADGLAFTIEVVTRSTQFRFVVAGGEARVRYRSIEFEDVGPEIGWVEGTPAPVPAFEAGRAVRIEAWHVDQQLSLFVDGELVVREPYDWRPQARMENATETAAGGSDVIALGSLSQRNARSATTVRLLTEGVPATLARIEVDRDLHYARYPAIRARNANPARAPMGELDFRYGHATHPASPAILGPDHFFMLGDNTLASSDSRAWGNPHPLVSEQVDPAPFVVHRSLLLGKAWVVYFPALNPISERGRGLVPNFGALRFIR